MNWEAVLLTARLSLLTTIVLVFVGMPLAYWLAFTNWRWKVVVEAVVTLPIVLPPTVLGFYVLVAIGPSSPFGQFYGWLSGHQLPFTFEGLLLASVLYSLPFAVQPFATAFASVDRSLLEAAWTMGASPFRTFFLVILPLSVGGVITGMVLSFAHTMGEFGVVLMVGGNIPGITRTISIDIYDRVQALDYAGAGQTSLFLLLVSFAALSALYAINRRLGAIWS